MGVSRLLRGSACLLSMMEFKWLQTLRFWVVFLLIDFWYFFCLHFWPHLRGLPKGRFWYIVDFWVSKLDFKWKCFLCLKHLRIDRFFCRFFLVFLTFVHRFGDFPGEAIFKAFGGDPFQVLVRLGSPRHLILRHIFWVFFEWVFEVQNGVQKCMKIGGCKSWSERDRVVSRGSFLNAFISRFQAPKSWNNLEIILN